MSVIPESLSQSDVERLESDQRPEGRVAIATKVAAGFGGSALGAEERRIAEDILRSLVKDAEVRVREALSAQLKDCPELPRDVALTLAQDVESVALPVLRYSEVLNDDDLVSILKAGGPEHHVAIASRNPLSAFLAETVIDSGYEEAVDCLVANEGAELDSRLLGRVLTEYGQSERIRNSLAQRPHLPAAISEQLMDIVTKQIVGQLAQEHALSLGVVSSFLRKARDRATISMLQEENLTDAELRSQVADLDLQGRLSTSMAFRALSVGNLRFFEMAMARLSGIPVENARALLEDDGGLGLESLLRTALRKSRGR
ncbi:MAG: DUF2336 domain-containing protein [Kiloniellales bacterium]|nr:DUF2336 domain-containing protein [Kiloniellales bacterium]